MISTGRSLAPKTNSPDELPRKSPKLAHGPVPVEGLDGADVLPEEQFLSMLCLERKRTERSRRSFVLMLLASSRLLRTAYQGDAFEKVLSALSRSTRDTDIKGWYREGSTIGVIFTEIGAEVDGRAVSNALLSKVTSALSGTLSVEQIREINLSFHVFPDDWDSQDPGSPADLTFYPDRPTGGDPRKRTARIVKRTMDVAGSLFALAFFAPLLLFIAALIKLTSRGPVLFRQERLGHGGKPFRFLKFRSMYVQTDESIHEEYMKAFISGKIGAAKSGGNGNNPYKLTRDSRVTPIGRFLRKTSLDELPQFMNVLMGEMSLVGPRPPIRYEAARYDLWHRDRLLAARPGITGLWQVEGRSRVTFDDMVRLDLKYARSWSLWLDIKILLRTPGAVLMGEGAY
jgi:lipopolysaccharide/colanic/teichoic acid biosynthesis glycosyltransferase